MSPADLAADAGRCWLDLGDGHRAAEAIRSGLDQLDPARRRTRTVFLTYQAECDLKNRDVAAAASHAREALDTAIDIKAARCLDLAKSVVTRFEGRPEPAAVELRDYARQQLTA
jgi:hypothetical protein